MEHCRWMPNSTPVKSLCQRVLDALSLRRINTTLLTTANTIHETDTVRRRRRIGHPAKGAQYLLRQGLRRPVDRTVLCRPRSGRYRKPPDFLHGRKDGRRRRLHGQGDGDGARGDVRQRRAVPAAPRAAGRIAAGSRTKRRTARTLAEDRRRVHEEDRQGFARVLHGHPMAVQETHRFPETGKRVTCVAVPTHFANYRSSLSPNTINHKVGAPHSLNSPPNKKFSVGFLRKRGREGSLPKL